MAVSFRKRQLQLVRQQPPPQSNEEEDERFLDSTCPECDCILEISYNEYGSQRFFCDNCGIAISGLSLGAHGKTNYYNPE